MKPFFCYYGGKWRAVKLYPKPKYRHIVEPFAGAAGYSTRYANLKITLYDANPVIFGVWDFLIKSTQSEILSLPVTVENVDDLQVPQEAKWLIGFWLNTASAHPCKTPSS